MVPTWKLSAVQVLALSAAGVAMGAWVQRRIPVLGRLNIPGPVIGGLLYAVLALLLRDRVLNFDMDASLRDLLILAFFTTVGWNARVSLLRAGGRAVLLVLLAALGGALAQGLLGIALAKLLLVNPLLGIMTGPVTLAGGPATAIAFGRTFEQMGLENAVTIGAASAIFGIVCGGLLGGPLGGWLIRRHQLRSSAEAAAEGGPLIGGTGLLMPAILAIAVSMGIGSILSAGIERMGVTLPAYIGAMVVAAVFANLDEKFGWPGIAQARVSEAGGVALSLFIVMALLTLRLWELQALAGPLLLMLAAQVPLTLLLAWGTFRLMRGYEGAVIASGYTGFMLGITANALACMEELQSKYGPAPKAFLTVPIVGAFLVDFTNALVITVLANLLK
jgi:glutamate:Na+ symporter, ESS family